MSNSKLYASEYKPSFLRRIQQQFMKWLRLTDQPVVKVYHGYGTNRHMSVFGHVFSFSPLKRKRFRKNAWTNTFALLRLFMVKAEAGAGLELTFQGVTIEGQTQTDGFFRFDWTLEADIDPGWHEATVRLIHIRGKIPKREVIGSGEIYVPYTNQYACISDIDDTFLISHSANLRKRMFVLLTENAHSRKPFDGVVRHYKLLARASTTSPELNPFFYVSSSEWNLFDYIDEFSRKNELPRGIFLLNQLKTFKEIWKTGQNKHATKFMRIARIMEKFPDQKFILLGDDSQEDPVIYASVAEHFPGQIRAVYLRHVYHRKVTIAREAIARIEKLGIDCCHFEHSEKAIEHSIKIGLVVDNIESHKHMKT